MVNKIVLACEYMTSPIFLYEDEDQTLVKLGFYSEQKFGPVDISSLNISNSLRENITMWDQAYQRTFNHDYPPDSGFVSPNEKEKHIKLGKKLAECLTTELGRGYDVEYKPIP
ncbi:hypothetical protein [Terasakiella sp.]|uniref:hypothetical protein n=1 Tax=Terasakiella sp. TaxID=2034861 RepID=UPI003AA833ED